MKMGFHTSLATCLALQVCVVPGCNKEEPPGLGEPQRDPELPQAEPGRFAGPPLFSDTVRFDYGSKQAVGIPDTPVISNLRYPEQAGFDMVLVPGDPERGIAPFYLSRTEVPANMFFPWATGDGLVGDQWEHWLSLDLQPSWISTEVMEYGPPDRPALSMSRTVAEHYCAWLSAQTGRRYRLPTEAEWVYALELGGGVPTDRDELMEQAWLADNTPESLDSPFRPLPAAVSTRKPNALGLYDMLGNAAEWVSATGEARVVRGGHFEFPADLLTSDWRAVEDLEAWNSTFPNFPLSTRWYHHFVYTGIRLALDADQAPAPLTPAANEEPEPTQTP